LDAELDYQPRMPSLASEGDGALIGSGDGAVHGPRLHGTLEWTLFERPGSTVCPMAPVARITTGDGAQIRFEGRGYATRAGQGDPSWRVAATLYFTTDDSRYSWLDGTAGAVGRRVQRRHPPRPVHGLHPADRPGGLTSHASHGPPITHQGSRVIS